MIVEAVFAVCRRTDRSYFPAAEDFTAGVGDRDGGLSWLPALMVMAQLGVHHTARTPHVGVGVLASSTWHHQSKVTDTCDSCWSSAPTMSSGHTAKTQPCEGGVSAWVAVARKLAVLLHRIWITQEVYVPFYQVAA
jgi:hypothetical protein